MINIESSTFKFSSKNHVNILGAQDGLLSESGMHKSHLFTVLRNEYVNGSLKSNKNLIFISNMMETQRLILSKEDCIIIDETNYAPNNLEKLFQHIKSVNSYLILIGRMHIKQVECSVDAIYALNYVDGYFNVNPVFTNVICTNLHADDIECEDSVSVASIYAEALEVDNMTSVSGRGNFYKYASKHECPLLIADKPKFGQNLLNMLYLMKTKSVKTKYLLLFLPESFEEILCEASNIKPLYNKEDYFDGEIYYEELASWIKEWNKKNVSKSIKILRNILDFENTSIIQDLRNYYNNKIVENETRCYVIDISKIDINDNTIFDLNQIYDVEKSTIFTK